MKTAFASLIFILLTPFYATGQDLPKILAEAARVSPAQLTAKVSRQAAVSTLGQNRFILPAFDGTNPANLAITLADSPHKQLLNSHTSYVQNNTQVFRALTSLRNRIVLPQNIQPPEMINQLRPLVKDTYLMKIVDQNLSKGNYAGALWDLTDFYGLLGAPWPSDYGFGITKNTHFTEDVFVDTTLDFLNRHPHKVPLRLREMLKNPQVGLKFKGSVQEFLRQPTPFSKESSQAFSSLLRAIYSDYSQLLTQAYQSPEVRITISYYNQALHELEKFVDVHQRAPRWDGPVEEKQLYNRLMIITRDNPFNRFTEALYPLQEIKNILAKYPVSTLSWEETTARLETFIEQHGFYPRSYGATNGNTTEEELRLLDQVHFYTYHHPQLENEIEQLKIKHHLPLH